MYLHNMAFSKVTYILTEKAGSQIMIYFSTLPK